MSEKVVRKIMKDHHLIAKTRIKKIKLPISENVVNIHEDNLLNNNYQTKNSSEK